MSIEAMLLRDELFPDYDPNAHLNAIHGLIDRVYSWRNELSAAIAEPTLDGFWAGDIYADMMQCHVYRETACSHAVVGALAPYFEGMFQHEFAYLRRLRNKQTPLNNHPRWKMKSDDFWNPRLGFNDKGLPSERGIARGSIDLLKALGIEDRFPGNFAQLIAALFTYRNAGLHYGYEWPMERRLKFQKDSAQYGWDQWFFWAKSDGQPWCCTLRDSFVQELLKAAEQAIHAFETTGEEWLKSAIAVEARGAGT